MNKLEKRLTFQLFKVIKNEPKKRNKIISLYEKYEQYIERQQREKKCYDYIAYFRTSSKFNKWLIKKNN